MKKSKISIGTIAIYTALILWALTTIFPFAWVILNSFKPSSEVLTSSFSLPIEFTMKNYNKAFDNLNIGKAYFYSIIISGSVTLIVMLLSSMMAFGMTRYQFKGKAVLHSLIIASLMFPTFAIIIPMLRMMVTWNWMNTLKSAILPLIATNLSFAVIVMLGFLQSLPVELEEAAYMEGANVFQVYAKIIIPLCKASLSTVGIFTFLWSYNDLFVQKMMIRDREMYPISALLLEISSKYGTDFGLMAASVTIIVVPVLIVYIFLQKNIIKGLTAGAIKG